jgi:hypothetical protein
MVRVFLLIRLGGVVPLACMIRVIPGPKEDQDEREAVSVLSKALYTRSEGGQAAEELWGARLPEGVEQREQRPMETRAS